MKRRAELDERRDEEEGALAEFVPIEDNPGFYRRRGLVYFRFRDHRRRQRWRSAKTIAAAKRLRAALETDVDRGEYRAHARVGFKSYALAWVESYQGRTSKRIEESTRDDYRRRLLEEAIPYFGETPITAIGPLDVKGFIAHVAKRPRRGKRWARDARPVSASTVRLAMAPVKALFATAFEEGSIRVNPAAGVRVVAPRAQVVLDEDDGGDVKALSEAELARVLAAVADEWRLLFVLLVHLGVRISELIELRWHDVDLAARTVKVRRKFYDGRVGPPKSRYGRRTLKLTSELAQALWLQRKQSRSGDRDLVFTAPGGGRLIASNLMSRVLKPAAVTAGLGEWVETADGPRAESWVGFHTFRHTCATLLFTKERWNPAQVQLWLGHHSAAFTVDTYIHLLPSDLPEAPSLARCDTDVTREARTSTQSASVGSAAETA